MLLCAHTAIVSHNAQAKTRNLPESDGPWIMDAASSALRRHHNQASAPCQDSQCPISQVGWRHNQSGKQRDIVNRLLTEVLARAAQDLSPDSIMTPNIVQHTSYEQLQRGQQTVVGSHSHMHTLPALPANLLGTDSEAGTTAGSTHRDEP